MKKIIVSAEDCSKLSVEEIQLIQEKIREDFEFQHLNLSYTTDGISIEFHNQYLYDIYCNYYRDKLRYFVKGLMLGLIKENNNAKNIQ